MVHLRRAIGITGTKPGNMSTSVREIYNREIVENPEGATNYTYLQSQMCVKKMRRRRHPNNPSTVEELIDTLSQHQNSAYGTTMQNPSSNFFQQHLPFMVEGERVGVIFSNLDAIQKYREELLTVTFAGIDGTFKTVPKSPPQLTKGCLLTFQVVLKNVSFPMVYGLTSRMTQATYESFLRIVREVLPLNYARLTIISDYERGLINAVESTFPESRFQGCWFHYCQAIVRYCRRSLNSIYHLFQSNPEAATILRMILALPHLSAQVHPNCTFTIHDGFWVIVEFANQYPNIYQQMEVFLNGYIQEFWLTQIGADSISVYGSDIRTNNYLESFHAMLLNQMGKHPNIWDFLQKLLLIENQFYVEMDQVRRNLTVRNHTSRVQRSDATRRVREYIDTLNDDGNLLMFLQRAGHMMDGYLHGQVGPQP
ncbi:uncharacterized protein LOC111026611 [Myzus persicae]|uniref:uncharacterized protein LOC111026611 n=1 Tax=Myzus persicae TaxID=13164 RepID=UPI000B9357F9|nr:uncharacterized protein LOC111026611 [Myzus persicae]